MQTAFNVNKKTRSMPFAVCKSLRSSQRTLSQSAKSKANSSPEQKKIKMQPVTGYRFDLGQTANWHLQPHLRPNRCDDFCRCYRWFRYFWCRSWCWCCRCLWVVCATRNKSNCVRLNAIWIFHAVVVQNFKSTQVKCADAEINLVCVATKLT